MADRLAVFATATAPPAPVFAPGTISCPSDGTEPGGIFAAGTVAGSAIHSGFPPRPGLWWNSRVVFDGSELWPNEFLSLQEFQDSIDQPIRTGKIEILGNLWTIPTSGSGITLSRLWGNAPVDAYLSLGTPRHMNEFKIMSGLALQKEADGDIAITGEVSIVDPSVEWNEIHVCYASRANAGLHRGDHVRAVAASVGLTVKACPVGGLVRKPFQVANKAILDWINADFGIPENWLASITDDGELLVEVIGIGSGALWVLDAANNDWDLDSSTKETAPTTAPTKFYIKGSFPSTDPGGSQNLVEITETKAAYNPVAASGYGNIDTQGNYHRFAAPQTMTVGRVTITRSLTDGIITRTVTKTESMYARQCVVGGSGNIFGDGTYRYEDFEILQTTRIEQVDYTYNSDGTVTQTVTVIFSMYLPEGDPNVYTGGHFSDGSGRYYPGASGLESIAESLIETNRATTTFTFTPGDAPIVTTRTVTKGWYAQQSKGPGPYNFILNANPTKDYRETHGETYQTVSDATRTVTGSVAGLIALDQTTSLGWIPIGQAGAITTSIYGLILDTTISYLDLGNGSWQTIHDTPADLTGTNPQQSVSTVDFGLSTDPAPAFPYPGGGTTAAIVLQPVVATGTITATAGQFYENTLVIDVSGSAGSSVGCETEEEMQRVLSRFIARACAIVRERVAPWDPRWRRGDTVLLIDPKKGIDALHMLVTTNGATTAGRPVNDMILEYWGVGS